MDTLEKLRLIINANTDFKDRIKPKDHLRNDLCLNSFDMLMIVRAVEDDFSIQIDDKELEGIETVEDIIEKLNNIKP